jgi:hypothetical protein
MALLACGPFHASAQSLDDLNIQAHGYATQAFLYSNRNNWNTTASSDGSAAWTEAVVNLSAQPEPRLRIGVQARYSLLGNLGNQITLDWAQADYRLNERLGIRAGKIKVPFGLFNESQDIDPSLLWILLPQSLYPIASRDSILSEYGAVVYGAMPLGKAFGKLEYRGYAGDRVLPSHDGYLQPLRDEGFTFPQGLSGKTSGETLTWIAPLKGLAAGASQTSGTGSSAIDLGPYLGTMKVSAYRQTDYFARYERGRLMVAAESGRSIASSTIVFPGLPVTALGQDNRPWYVMGTYRIAGKLSGGAYYSSVAAHRGLVISGPGAYQKDWTAAIRYDFTPFLYAKAEQHWMDGTLVGFSTSNNTALQPNTRMSLLKLGVSF